MNKYSLADAQEADDRTSNFIHFVSFDTEGHWTAENIYREFHLQSCSERQWCFCYF